MVSGIHWHTRTVVKFLSCGEMNLVLNDGLIYCFVDFVQPAMRFRIAQTQNVQRRHNFLILQNLDTLPARDIRQQTPSMPPSASDVQKNPMRSPQLHQQSIEVHQFLAIHFLNWAEKVGEGTDNDPNPPKVFEFDGLKRFSDPLNIRDVRPKVYMSEFCDFGEVERRRFPRFA